MRIKRDFCLIVVIVLMFLFCSCAKGGCDLKVEISPSNKNLVDLVTNVYSEAQLLEIVKLDGSINTFNSRYPIECLREDNGMYRLSYLGDESIAVLLFDDLGNKRFGNKYSTLLVKSDFDRLEKGQSLDEVKATDPNGEYLFLYTGRNDTPKISSHYTKDGYLITIEYNDSNIIQGVNVELI